MGEDEIIVRQVASASEGETRALGLKIASLLRPGDIILLIGELGTGKTVLAKGVARGLGVKENILSPTFTLLKEYAGKVPLYHLDAYRLHGAGDLYELGLEEYLEEGVLLVEWGDRVHEFFKEEFLEVRMDFAGDESRSIRLIAAGSHWGRRLRALDMGGDLIV